MGSCGWEERKEPSLNGTGDIPKRARATLRELVLVSADFGVSSTRFEHFALGTKAIGIVPTLNHCAFADDVRVEVSPVDLARPADLPSGRRSSALPCAGQ